jgi:hypothetical protein
MVAGFRAALQRANTYRETSSIHTALLWTFYRMMNSIVPSVLNVSILSGLWLHHDLIVHLDTLNN